MRQKTKRFILKKGLFRGGEHSLVGVSGGADSVCLLHLLADLAGDLGIGLTVAHLNHGIRGEAADADEGFVIELSKSLGLKVVSSKVNIPLRARRSGKSVEMCARDARYGFFAKTARKLGADCVATAHTADDQVETVILNIARGAGLAGIGGIPVESCIGGLRTVRPLLHADRKQVERYLEERGIAWREDASNADVSYLRNRVRHEIIPVMKERLNPSLVTAVSRSTELLREDAEYLDELARDVWHALRVDSGRGVVGVAVPLDCGSLAGQNMVMRKRVIRMWLLSAGVPVPGLTADVVESVDGLVKSRKGTGSIDVAGRYRVARKYDRLTVQAWTEERECLREFCRRLLLRGQLKVPEARVMIRSSIEPGLVRQTGAKIGRFPARASISRGAVGRSAVTVRSWQAGDRMCPLGMKGSKKLQDIFVDARVPLEMRARIPVFVCRGEIIWVPGYRVARGWEVRNPEDLSVQLHIDECSN